MDNTLVKKIVKLTGFNFTEADYSIQDPIDKSYLTIFKHPTDRKIRQHLKGKYSICLPRYKHTKIYCMDIDYHDSNIIKAIKSIKSIVKLIGEPFYIERSEDPQGGFHLYFRFETYLYPNVWHNLQQWLKDKLDITVETITYLKKFKLPFSYFYTIHGKFNLNKRDLIERLPRDICISLFEQKESLPVTKFLNSLSFYGKPAEKVQITKPEQFGGTGITWQSFSYGLGQRTNTQFKLAIRSVFWGYTFSEYVQECYTKNCGSKDMKNWSPHRIHKDLEKKWQTACRYVSANKSAISVSKYNDLYISDSYKTILSTQEEQRLKIYLTPFVSTKYSKVRTRFVQDCITFYKVCLSIQQYRTKKNYRYEGEFDYLNKGIPLSRDIRSKIGKYLNLSNHFEIYKFLLMTKILTVIHNEKGYSYSYKIKKWVKHFIITKINDLQRVANTVLKIFFLYTLFDKKESNYYNNYVNINSC